MYEVELADTVRRSTADVRGLTVARNGELVRPGDGQPPEHLTGPRIQGDDLIRRIACDVEDPAVRREDRGVRASVRGVGIRVPRPEQRVRVRVHDRDGVRSVQAERDELAA